MALLPSPSSSCHHRAAPFPAATAASASARPRRGSLRVAAAGGRSGPTATTMQPRPAAVDRRRCECFDLHQQMVPYAEAYAWQKSIVKRRIGLLDSGEEDHSDTLIALQHPPVYTLGTISKEEYLHFNKEDAPFEIQHIDRGGEVTYHGPGQVTRRSHHPCTEIRVLHQGIKGRRPHWCMGWGSEGCSNRDSWHPEDSLPWSGTKRHN